METTTATTELPVPAQPLGVINPLPLHWFQKDAVAAAVGEVKDGGRATVFAATSSGKTLIAAGCARRLVARGRVLVLVPTIELLELRCTLSFHTRIRSAEIFAESLPETAALMPKDTHSQLWTGTVSSLQDRFDRRALRHSRRSCCAEAGGAHQLAAVPRRH